MTNRQARIKRFKEAFQKVEQLMNESYVVQWDGDNIIDFVWSPDKFMVLFAEGYIEFGENCRNRLGWVHLDDLTISEIDTKLKEYLTVWKKVEIKL